MQLCGKKIPVPRFIILRLRKLFRGSRQVSVRETLASDESWTAVDVDGDLMPQTAESSVDEDSEPLLAASVYRDEHLLPLDCAKLGSADVEIFTTLPNRAGAFTNVWNGSLAGDRVVIKSYRLYSAEDFTHARMRYYKEALACSKLSHRNIVQFRAAYTTSEHPLALVYDFVEHWSLREYLRENAGIRRVRLLTDIARGLFHMHDLGIIHGNLKMSNILVDLDGAARIGGFGSSFAPSQNHASWSEMDAEILFYGAAPELVRPNPPRSRIKTTKESDIYAFALLMWEFFAGQVPFSDRNQFAAIHLLANGFRPPRPHHPELSDRVWELIQKCWHHNPSHRMSIGSILSVLEAEVS